MELAGPFIAKIVIDDHILGVEGYWQEVAENDDRYTVDYDGGSFKRVDRLTASDETIGEAVTLLQIGTAYHFIHDRAPLDGKRDANANDNQISITTAEGTFHYGGERLALTEAYPFFKPEQRPILLLLGLYIGLLVIAGIFQFYKTFLLQKAANQIVKKCERIYLRIHSEFQLIILSISLQEQLLPELQTIRKQFVIYMKGY